MIVPLIVSCALFMEFLDGTAVLTALPAIAKTLATDAGHLSIIVSVYFLSFSILIPASGWIADRWGARTVFQSAIGIFTLASILCGISGGIFELTAARLFQGCGAALMTPVARLILLRKFPKSELVRAMAWFSMPALIGPMIAPVLGGFLTDYASWRWIFFINIPIGIIAIVLTAFTVENYRGEGAKPFDWGGFALTAASLAALISIMDMIAHNMLSVPIILLGGVGTSGLVLLTLLHARRQPHSILDLSLLELPTFRVSNIGGLLYRTALNAILVLQPILLQVGFGKSALQSGALTLFGAFGLFAMRPWVRNILRRFGFRTTLLWNALWSALAVFILCPLAADTALPIFAAIFFIGGLTRSLQFMSYSTIVFAEVPADRSSAAASFSSLADRFSGALGASLAGVLLSTIAVLEGGNSDRLNAGDIRLALAVLGVLVCLAGLETLRLRPDAGAEVSGNSKPAEKT